MATSRGTHVTDSVLAARADARARSGAAAAMPYRPAAGSPHRPAGVDAEELVWAETVQGGGYTHRVVERGTRLRFDDPAGDACAHVLLFNALAPWERLNVADTQKIPWQAYLGEGHPLLSGDGRVLATIVADSSNRHDAFCGTSTDAANRARYGASAAQTASPSGRALFLLGALKEGLQSRDLAPSISFFKGVRVDADGTLVFTGSAGPGTSVEIVAELPLIVLVANVPHPLDPRPQYTVSELRVHGWRASPTGFDDPLFESTVESNRAYRNTIDYATSRGIA